MMGTPGDVIIDMLQDGLLRLMIRRSNVIF